MSGANQGANQSYPQTVNLDTAKAKAADLQSQTSKAQGGNINPTDPASKARSAASQSQHVVNILTSGDPVNAGDVDKVEADERSNNNTGLLAKGGPTAKIQGAESQLSQVADRKVADKDVINQGDATQIARAEAKLNNGQIPPNSISAKAQSAADMALQSGMATKPEA